MLPIQLFLVKIILFTRTFESTQLCKISQKSDLKFNFASLPKIRNAHFRRCDPLKVTKYICQTNK